MKYKIIYGYTRTGKEKCRKFATNEAAIERASAIFTATGIVVAIVPV